MLIVFEGVHSAGKSTQIDLLRQWFDACAIRYTATSWNSFDDLGPLINRLKIEDKISPLGTVLLEAADLALRYERGLKGALARGDVVISDRNTTTGYVRGLVRGVEREFIDSCFSFAPVADVVFFLDCSGGVTLERRIAANLSIGGALAGADYMPVDDLAKAFVAQQDLLNRVYREVLPSSVILLDGTSSPDMIHAQVRAVLNPMLAGTVDVTQVGGQ